MKKTLFLSLSVLFFAAMMWSNLGNSSSIDGNSINLELNHLYVFAEELEGGGSGCHANANCASNMDTHTNPWGVIYCCQAVNENATGNKRK